MAGRPRKPAQLKIIQGTFQKSRNPESEAQFSALDKLPPAPKALNKHSKRLWAYGAELVSAGVITKPDIIAFELCCDAYGRYMALRDHIAKNLIKNIEGQQMNADLSACEKLMAQFGMTPSSRNRFGVSKKKEIDPETERMKELLGA